MFVKNHKGINSNLTKQLDFYDIFIALGNYKSLLLIFQTIFCLWFTIVYNFSPNLYTSKVTIIPPGSSNPNNFIYLHQNEDSQVDKFLIQHIFKAFIQSESLYDLLILRLDLKSHYGMNFNSDVKDILKKSIKIKEDPKTGLISVQFSYKDPNLSAKLVNTIPVLLGELISQFLIDRSNKQLGFFDSQINHINENIISNQTKFLNLSYVNGYIDNHELYDSNVKLSTYLRQQIERNEIQKLLSKSYMTNKNHDLIKVENDILVLQSTLKQLENGFPRANTLSGNHSSHSNLSISIKIQGLLLDYYLSRMEFTKLDLFLTPTSSFVLDSGFVSETSSKPSFIIFFILNGFFYLLISIFLCFIVHLVRKFLTSADNTKKFSKLKFAWSLSL